jgi:hypothetical protein
MWDIESGKLLRQWRLSPGLVDAIAFPSDKGLYVLRMETMDGTEMPSEEVPWQANPRVCRLRNLLASDPLKPVLEIEEFNVGLLTAVASSDGRYFALEGVGNTDGKSTRSIVVLEATSGRTVWREKSAKSPAWGKVFFSPEGSRLGYTTNGPDWCLLDLDTTKKPRRLPNSPSAVGTDGQLWTGLPPDNGPGAIIYRDNTPLVTVGVYSDPGGDPQFDSAGRQLAWGNKDGTVNVCDLAEISRHLAGYGISLKIPVTTTGPVSSIASAQKAR